MDATPCATGRSAVVLGDGGSKYLLRIAAQKSEVDLAKQFLTKGGMLGGAAARGNTSFALSHAETHDTFLLTGTNQTIDLPVPAKLLETSRSTFFDETKGEMSISDNVGPHVLLSDRTRLNVVSTRTGAAINGTLVSTISGTASVKMLDLFSTVDVKQVAPGATGRAPRPTVAVTQIPIRYPNWEAINATLAVCAPQLIRVASDGSETEVSALFFTPVAQAARLAQVQPVIKRVYDRAWKMTKDAPFVPEPNLHKSVVAEREAGLDGSGYSFAAAANDTPQAFGVEVAESILGAALAQELPGTYAQMLLDLSVPSLKATGKYGQSIATALSGIAAYAMPYRVDGTPATTPEGLKMYQSESWPVNANADPFRLGGDCEDQAKLAGAFIDQSVSHKMSGANMDLFPNMRAVANSIGAHYVHGLTVLAANAGHADAADSSNTKIAGHAINLAISKVSFGMAMARGAKATINGEYVVAPEFQSAVLSAQWAALYPESLLNEMPPDERHALASPDAARHLHTATMATGPQPLAIEGTTFASSQLYEHNEATRGERQRDSKASATSLEPVSPNVLRIFKTLDVSKKGVHAFYNAIVEQSFSLKHGLMTSGPLRSMNAACCHVRYAQVSPAGEVVGSGSSPKDIATGNFALVPLWTAGTEDGALIDEAHAEALSNALPMRGEPISASTGIFHKNMATLRGLDAFFHEAGKPEYDSFPHQAIVSFASLVGNEHALTDISEVLKASPQVRGEIYGLDTVIKGLATGESGEELGRYIVIEVDLPRN